MTIRKGKTIIAGNIPAGYEIGDIGLSAIGIDESLNYRRYLNGQEILQAQFPEFTKKIKRRVELYPSLACSDYQYETYLLTSAHGQCGKFVIDDERGVIRLPKVVNVMGLSDMAEAGVTVDAGLPDHRHVASTSAININVAWTSGLILTDNTGYSSARNTGYASEDNPIYGNSETVQQEAIKYPYFIQVASSCETTINLTRDIELNNPFSLFEYKFSEYAIDNISWLESKGQWNSNKVYVSAYEELLAIYNGKVREGVSVKKTTETYTDYDFVIDEAGNAFRLPIRVKETPLSAGKVGVAGNGMTLGLTTGGSNAGAYTASNFNVQLTPQYYGADVGSGVGSGLVNAGTGTLGVTSDKTKSGIEADLTDAVVDLKLYFYVGETVQDGNLINAGAVLEDVNTLKNTALTTNQITNCITEIPQRIKLEFINGVITIYEGSQFIVPNGFEVDGTPKFDYVTASHDVTISNWGTTAGDVLVAIDNELGLCADGETYSSTEQPTQNNPYVIWYDMTENIVKRLYNGTVSKTNLSLPFMIIHRKDGGAIDELKQVFNGMGYIGSTVWVDKGVKGLIPNGRNEDGTLRNIEYTTKEIKTLTDPISRANQMNVYIYNTGNLGNSTRTDYNYVTNYNKDTIDTTIKRSCFLIGSLKRDTEGVGTISRFSAHQPFAVYPKSVQTGYSMPSTKYIDLTLGASGAQYIAPANGWVGISKVSTAAGQTVEVGSRGVQSVYSQSNNQGLKVFMPVRKGGTFYVSYTATGTIEHFRFHYAEGEV